MGEELGLWHDYYVLVGNVGAVLAGLVFVAMTLRPVLAKKDNAAAFVARQIFGNFVGVVFISLVMVAPWSDARWLGAVVALTGSIGFGLSLQRLRVGMRGGRLDIGIAAQLLVLLAGVGIALGVSFALPALGVGTGVIELIAFVMTWQLVVTD